MAAALLPFLPALAGAAIGAIPSIISLARGRGGKVSSSVRRQKKVRRVRRMKGKGPIADVVEKIPLLGLIGGPLLRSLGAGALSNMQIKRHFGGKIYRAKARKATKRTIKRKKGYGYLYPPGGQYAALLKKVGKGLLMPPGRVGGRVHVRGHYRIAPSGKRVHVKPHYTSKPKGGALAITLPTHRCRFGGYIPHTF